MSMSSTSLRRWASLPVAGVLALAALAGSGSPAGAAPGSPGVPSNPTVLFTEDFESGLADGAGQNLVNYQGGAYTASSYWLNASQGNGLIVDGTTTNATMQSLGFGGATAAATGGTVGGRLRALANAIGAINGSSPSSTNHAVTAWSSTGSANDTVEFRTVNPLNLPVSGRFVTLTANVSATSCNSAKPQLNFFVVDGGTETKVNSATLGPCPSSGAPNGALYTDRLVGDNTTLFSGSTVGLVMRNQTTSSSGNDHAYDDITLLDVTPQLDKEYDAPAIQPGETSTLTFTITNTSDLLAKSGWSITEALPAGVTVANATTGGTCGASISGATVGSDTVTITNGSLPAGAASCTITIQVTATGVGAYTSQPGDSTVNGLNAPAAATLDVAPVVGTPAINPTVGLAAGAGVAVVAGLVLLRRRSAAAPMV